VRERIGRTCPVSTAWMMVRMEVAWSLKFDCVLETSTYISIRERERERKRERQRRYLVEGICEDNEQVVEDGEEKGLVERLRDLGLLRDVRASQCPLVYLRTCPCTCPCFCTCGCCTCVLVL
jgi:hypothetical protein